MSNTTKKFIYITLGMGALVLIAYKVFGSTINDTIGNGPNLVVGDSHAVMIGSKVKNAKVDPSLAHSGWNVSDLQKALDKYSIDLNVSNIFISIGTNSGFNASDKIENLVNTIFTKFPNAYVYIFRGSYGWSGRWENPNASNDQVPYYQRFANMGVTILDNGLGYFPTDAKAHSTSSPQAKAIIDEINSYTSN